jgi:hypothetical protein
MTLKQKFKQWLGTEPRLQTRDEFAIGFAEWILDNYDSDDASKFGMFYTKNMEELLETYKKAKGL